MTESYCLKSCTECGQCGGCRVSVYAERCEIVKCCKEKNHSSCESCTRAPVCTLRAGREQMPQKLRDRDRREAELRQAYRARAAVMGRWTNVIFWCMVTRTVVGLFDELPLLAWVGYLLPVLFVAECFAYFRMKEADEEFAVVAGMNLAVQAMGWVADLLPNTNWLIVILAIIVIAVGLLAERKKCWTFRDSLSGISAVLSEKWEKQWTLYKIALCSMGAGVLLVFIPVIGAVAMLAGLGLLVFVAIREMVYLYQTAQTCQWFEQMEN